MERYLYFTNPNDSGDPDAFQEVALYPTSSILTISAFSLTETRIYFVPRDGKITPEDHITLTHTAGGHKVIMEDLSAIINAEKNNNPFSVVSDKANGIYNLRGLTGCAIVSAT